MLFPTIRFALFFALVMPASWLLMPLATQGRRSRRSPTDQPWAVPTLLLAAAAIVGPLAPSAGWPLAVRALLWLLALGFAVQALVRWFDLTGLTRWNVFILVASYVFYGNYDWHFVALLAASTIVNQVIARNIDRQRDERTRRLWLLVAVGLNLGVLGWFKYKGFFTESASSILGPLGIDFTPPARAIIPPVGISFFTFQALSYVIDTYRRKLRPVPLLEFAVYLSFFPHLVAGPIVRASEFLPQLRVPRDARRVDSGLAFWLITIGLFKKVVVSSYLASAIVDPVFRIPSQHQAVDTLLGIYGYAIQIYCDFSGYTDMAIGLALLLGFRFPQNFDAPYTSASLQEFWRRWHMTLSRWLRDYLYIPLGGNQRGAGRAYLNLFLTMLIGGLWHGAAWTFVVWGALHGGYLAGERWLGERPRRTPLPDGGPGAERAPDGGLLDALAEPAERRELASLEPDGGVAPGGSPPRSGGSAAAGLTAVDVDPVIELGEPTVTVRPAGHGDHGDHGDLELGDLAAELDAEVDADLLDLDDELLVDHDAPGPARGEREPVGAAPVEDSPQRTGDRLGLGSLPPLSPTARLWLGRVLTFHVVCLGWVFFRAPDLTSAFHVLGRLFSFGTGQGINLMVVATIAVFLGSQFVPSDLVGRAQATFSRLPVWQQGVLLAVALVVTSSLAPAGVAPFIYFAF